VPPAGASAEPSGSCCRFHSTLNRVAAAREVIQGGLSIGICSRKDGNPCFFLSDDLVYSSD
jgi:hypothetical protein